MAIVETPELSTWDVKHRFGIQAGPSLVYRNETRWLETYGPGFFNSPELSPGDIIAYETGEGSGQGIRAFRVEVESDLEPRYNGTGVMVVRDSEALEVGATAGLNYTLGIDPVAVRLGVGYRHYFGENSIAASPTDAWSATVGVGYSF